MTPTLGDFLQLARQHLTSALSSTPADLPGDTKQAVIGELDRVIAMLARYFDDVTLPSEDDPATPALATQAHATLHAGQALQRAAMSMKPEAQALAPARPDATSPDAAHPVVRHLAAAADCLAAGRDLLQTHFTISPDGYRSANSWHTSVITSAPITWALAGEIASLAHQLAPWILRPELTAPGDPALPPPARLALQDASQWLWIAGSTTQTAASDHPPTHVDHALLHAIPLNTPPPRQQSSGSEIIPQLCQGTISTAERLRQASRRFAPYGRWSPATTAGSWRRDARAIAITCHSSELILRTLAEQAGHLGAGTVVTAALQEAAGASGQASIAWRAATSAWDTITTSRHPTLTPVAAEIGDLVLWTGRLAHNGVDWSPVRAHASAPLREPGELAPSHRDFLDALAAIHHASDAVTRIGLTDRKAIKLAAIDQRLHVTTRSRTEDCDIPYPYVPAPLSRINALLSAYHRAISASQCATAALDGLAVTLDAPSRMLAAAHAAAANPRSEAAQEGVSTAHRRIPARPRPLPSAGRAEETVRTLQISDPALLARAMAADEEASNLIAEATTKSRRRKTIVNAARNPRPGAGQGQRRPARLAAQDLPQQAFPGQTSKGGQAGSVDRVSRSSKLPREAPRQPPNKSVG